MRFLIGSLIVLFSFSVPGLAIEQPGRTTLESFTPSGTIKEVSQVTARFSESMVPFGDPTAIAPFDIKCPVNGTAHWIDDKNWVYDFGKNLPAGITCEFSITTGLKSVKGNPIEGQLRYGFSTGGPAIREIRPYEGKTDIQEDQVFVLILDAPANPSSVLENLYFVVSGIPERIEGRVLEGRDRDLILKSEYLKNYLKGEQRDLAVLVQAKQRFPSRSQVSLNWGKGILSRSGVATTEELKFPFTVRTPFLADFSCERENLDAACIPFASFNLSFSSPISTEAAKKIVLRTSKGDARSAEGFGNDETTQFVQFKGPFPERTEFSLHLPPELKDDFDRLLENRDKFPLRVRTDRFPPLAKFSGDFGIIEWKSSPVLPVTLRNLEPAAKSRLFELGRKNTSHQVQQIFDRMRGQTLKLGPEQASDITGWIKRVKSAKREASVFTSLDSRLSGGKLSQFDLPKKLGPNEFEVVGIPMSEPGFYVVEIESSALGAALLGKPKPMYVPTSVLVTNLGVHFKWGRESSLAWVTALDSGKPVENVNVSVLDCEGKSLWKGSTLSDGTVKIQGIPKPGEAPFCKNEDYSELNSGLLVVANHFDDMAFVHTSWNAGIETWRFSVSQESRGSSILAHTVLDRSLLRAGDTVHMKHIAREHSTRGIVGAQKEHLPNSLTLIHQGSETKYHFPLKWDAAGVALTDWKIPKEAKLGTYDIELSRKKGARLSGGAFRVEEFRVPLMKAAIQTPSVPVLAGDSPHLDVSVAFLSGGGAARLPVKLRTQYQTATSLTFPDFEDYVFSAGSVKEGKKRTNDSDSEDVGGGEAARTDSREVVLDASGTARITLRAVPKKEMPFPVLSELQFSDPNGEVQTVASTFSVYPSRRLVGLKLDSWAGSKEDLKIPVAVVDVKGKGVPDARVRVDLFEKKTYSHRKRIIGGFYSYENFEEVKKLAALCEGKTDARGMFLCQAKSPVSGNVILQASTDGTEGANVSYREVWIAGGEEWWFANDDHDRMDVIPESKRYEPGETAKFQVRMPFREATALIAVEREGIVDVYVRELSGKHPFVEIPVKPHYAPNVFVSVLAVRGRVGDVQPTALVDLGKPAYKLGIGEIHVGWKPFELKVAVTPDKTVYKVRDKAKVKVSVRNSSGEIPADAEVAIAVVDEGLLELLPNRSWKLLDAMMNTRGYSIENSTAQMQVVGKRHFGVKALPHGGGGGNQPTRELFDTLVYWKARVPLISGEAVVDFPLNDSLTSFQIVAVAQAGQSKFGTGTASIRSSQDLMLFAGIPPLARQGDRIQAPVTVRNTTEAPLDVVLKLTARENLTSVSPVSVRLEPNESRELSWDIQIPDNASSMNYTVEAAQAGESGKVLDRFKVTQKIVEALPARTLQATLAQVDGRVQVPVEIPKGASKGKGGVQVTLSSSLLAGLEGVREYMANYPHRCLEQMASRAVALQDAKLWNDVVGKIPSYLDYDGLAKYFPSMNLGSDELTSYLLAISHEAGWKLGDDSKERMIKGLTRFVEGSIQRYSSLPTADLSIRKIAALEAISRYQPALRADLLGSITIEPTLWPTSAVLDWVMLLRRAKELPDRANRLAQAEQILRSRINYQGTVMVFSTEKNDRLWWLMVSADQNSVKAVLAGLGESAWANDLPKLIRGALGRQQRGHWDLTTANAWGVLAVKKFAQTFEREPVAGTTALNLGPNQQAVEWKAETSAYSISFPWPKAAEALVANHKGAGKPWALIQSVAAIPLKEPLFAGLQIEKTIKPVERKNSKSWTRGDLARVTLKLSSQGDLTWVVVSDPIPAGSTLLGSGLGRDSSLGTQGQKTSGNWPDFEERSFEAYRAYYSYVAKGEWTIEYTVRLNSSGELHLPPSRVEAMYNPEIFGELPNLPWMVAP